MEESTFNLKATSAAIIINQDMSMEVILPKLEDGENVDLVENQNIFISMAIASLADSEDFRKLVSARVDTMLEAAGAMAEDDKNNPPITPCDGGCSGGCCGHQS